MQHIDSDMVKSSTGVALPAADDIPCIVIDTNVLLDIWVYRNPATPPLLAALEIGQLRWLATAAMREELLRVLNYAHIAMRRDKEGLSLQAVMEAFDRLSLSVDDAPRCTVVCKDPDDQKFIGFWCKDNSRLVWRGINDPIKCSICSTIILYIN